MKLSRLGKLLFYEAREIIYMVSKQLDKVTTSQTVKVTRSRPISLSLILIAPFVLQIVVVVGLTNYLSIRNGQKAVNDVATQLRTEIGTRVTQYLSTYLETPHLINRMNADAVRLGKLDLQDLSAVERHRRTRSVCRSQRYQ
jgi:hypothetical protein